jgi:hypothetical protein
MTNLPSWHLKSLEIKALHERAAYRLALIDKDSTDADYLIHMIAQAHLQDLAWVALEVRKELPEE